MPQLNPYLNVADGQARAAMDLYQSVLGGELSRMTFGDMGMEGPLADQVMHSQLETPGGLILMCADAPPEMVQVTYGDNVSVSISGGPDEADELHGWFDALAEGGQIAQPLAKAPWGDEFGSLKDRFGISWLFNIGQ